MIPSHNLKSFIDRFGFAVIDVTDARTRAQSHAEADRRQRNPVAPLVVDAGAAHVIKAAVDRGEPHEDALDRSEVINEHENFRCVGAQIEADRRPVPVQLARAARFRMQHAFAVA